MRLFKEPLSKVQGFPKDAPKFKIKIKSLECFPLFIYCQISYIECPTELADLVCSRAHISTLMGVISPANSRAVNVAVSLHAAALVAGSIVLALAPGGVIVVCAGLLVKAGGVHHLPLPHPHVVHLR